MLRNKKPKYNSKHWSSSILKQKKTTMLRLRLVTKRKNVCINIWLRHSHHASLHQHTLPAFLPAGSPVPHAAIATANQKALKVLGAAHKITMICTTQFVVKSYVFAGPSDGTISESIRWSPSDSFSRRPKLKWWRSAGPYTGSYQKPVFIFVMVWFFFIPL